MWVHRLLDKNEDEKPPTINVEPLGDVSSITLLTDSSSVSPVKHHTPKFEQIRKIALAKQKQHIRDKLLDSHKKRAHKWATEWYMTKQLRQKARNKKSSQSIAE